MPQRNLALINVVNDFMDFLRNPMEQRGPLQQAYYNEAGLNDADYQRLLQHAEEQYQKVLGYLPLDKNENEWNAAVTVFSKPQLYFFSHAGVWAGYKDYLNQVLQEGIQQGNANSITPQSASILLDAAYKTGSVYVFATILECLEKRLYGKGLETGFLSQENSAAPEMQKLIAIAHIMQAELYLQNCEFVFSEERQEEFSARGSGYVDVDGNYFREGFGVSDDEAFLGILCSRSAAKLILGHVNKAFLIAHSMKDVGFCMMLRDRATSLANKWPANAKFHIITANTSYDAGEAKAALEQFVEAYKPPEIRKSFLATARIWATDFAREVQGMNLKIN
ncbi:MAG: hypothetical protein GC136_03870 [Alphaproteobacteria bacterium]|nr:hypothetical protein [Alphaproteobacteria bacterium]